MSIAHSRRLVGAALLSLAAACGGVKPAPYVPPAPGTVYFWSGGMVTQAKENRGLRSSYVDLLGRTGSRIALFIPESPGRPAVVDSAAVSKLWPLQVGKEGTLQVKRGDEVEEWEFRVRAYEQVSVPAGSFMAYWVQATQMPKLARDPKNAISATHSWWYAPELNAVVRWSSKYMTGPTAGKEFGASIEEIIAPNDSLGLKRAAERRMAMQRVRDSLAKVQQAGKARADGAATTRDTAKHAAH